MKIFDNGIDFKTIGAVKQGFLAGLVDEAEHNLRESDASALDLSEDVYDELENVSFFAKNVDPDAVKQASEIIDSFFNVASAEQKKLVEAMSEEQKISFGMDLFYSLLYDNGILGDSYRSALEAVPPVNASPVIGQSVDGDIRVFFV